VAKIVRVALQKPKNDLLKVLKQNSDEATRRFEQYRHLTDKYLVVSFFEGQPYGKMGIVRLPKDPRKRTLLTLDRLSTRGLQP